MLNELDSRLLCQSCYRNPFLTQDLPFTTNSNPTNVSAYRDQMRYATDSESETERVRLSLSHRSTLA